MRIVLQRVQEASVKVNTEVVGSINQGYLLLIGFEPTDTSEDFDWAIRKVCSLKLFDGPVGQQNIQDIDGGILVVSQFTLHAKVKKGTKPSFSRAAPPQIAKGLYNQFIEQISASHKVVQSGIFGANMRVSLINDGPVTLLIDTKNKDL